MPLGSRVKAVEDDLEKVKSSITKTRALVDSVARGSRLILEGFSTIDAVFTQFAEVDGRRTKQKQDGDFRRLKDGIHAAVKGQLESALPANMVIEKRHAIDTLLECFRGHNIRAVFAQSRKQPDDSYTQIMGTYEIHVKSETSLMYGMHTELSSWLDRALTDRWKAPGAAAAGVAKVLIYMAKTETDRAKGKGKNDGKGKGRGRGKGGRGAAGAAAPPAAAAAGGAAAGHG